METEARAFAERLSARIYPILTQLNLAQWGLSTTGAPEHKDALERLGAVYTRLFTADPAEWATIQRLYAERGTSGDELLRREIEQLYYSFAAAQVAPEHIDRTAALEAGLTDLYTNFRGMIDGKSVSENQINTVLREETDSELRREAWDASKQIGVAARDGLLELVEMRNQSARALGFRDFYAQSLALQEIDEAELFAVLDDLEARSREPFRAIKAQLDQEIAARCRIGVEQLRSWHYSDPFFQELPQTGGVDLDGLFKGQDILALATRTFDGIGLEVRDVLARSDLFERENKDQHAFCMHIDRATDDVRMLCNIRPDARWMSTILHELGHAVYDKYLAPNLPLPLRTAAHINTTEAVAMLMGRLAGDADWLTRVRGIDGAAVSDLAEEARAEERATQLVFARWALVMVYFERALYAGPQRADLNALWWDLIERFQLVPRPDSRDAPDWAAKIHLATAPVYYHNYILGELTASQLNHAIKAKVPGSRLVDNPAAGAFLRDQLFALGARYPWNATLERVTGERLSSRHYVEDFIGG